MKPQVNVPPVAEAGGHESSGVDLAKILRVAVSMAVILFILLLVLLALFHHLERTYAARTSEAAPEVRARDLPPTPRLQADPLRDLQAVREKEDLHLDRFSWIDRQRGVAQIPIGRAMDLWLHAYATTVANPSGVLAPGIEASPPATTELQMRQEKAREGSHVP